MSAPIEHNTAYLQLPLPHPANDLGEDVLRLRRHLVGLDSKIAALDRLLGSNDLGLDSLQELVDAIKAARSDLGALNTLVASQLASHSARADERFARVDQRLGTLAAWAQALQDRELLGI